MIIGVSKQGTVSLKLLIFRVKVLLAIIVNTVCITAVVFRLERIWAIA